MSKILSIASIGCLALAGIFLLAAIILFFALDVRGVYAEMKGKTPPRRIRKKKSLREGKEAPTEASHEEPTIIEDEAVTVLDNGEIDLDSLVGFYEPGTDIEEESATELAQEQPTVSENFSITDMEEETSTGMDQEMPTAMDKATALGEAPDPQRSMTAGDFCEVENPTAPDILLGDAQTSIEEVVTDVGGKQKRLEIQCDIVLADRDNALYQLINQSGV